jgi:predicted DNA-binding transcriptional regulator AlpA
MRKPSKPSHPTESPQSSDSPLPTNVLPHRKRGRNGNGEGDASRLGRVALRLADLKASGIVRSWPAVAHFIREEGFPRGHLLGERTRIWWKSEIDAWLNKRPQAPIPPAPKEGSKKPTGKGRGRPRKATSQQQFDSAQPDA